MKGTPKAVSFDNDEIYNLLYYQYGQAYTYSVLAFIYPSLDFRNKFHQDHIFPKKLFTRKRLATRLIPEDEIDFYLDNYNHMANLQLLEGTPNQEKSGKDFKDWLEGKYPNKDTRKTYMEKHYILNVDLSLKNFREFIEERQKLIVETFKKLLV